MPLKPLTEDVTPARINFNVKNTKYPPAMAEAIGNPTSATILKKSILSPKKCLTVSSIYDMIMWQIWYFKIKVG